MPPTLLYIAFHRPAKTNYQAVFMCGQSKRPKSLPFPSRQTLSSLYFHPPSSPLQLSASPPSCHGNLTTFPPSFTPPVHFPSIQSLFCWRANWKGHYIHASLFISPRLSNRTPGRFLSKGLTSINFVSIMYHPIPLSTHLHVIISIVIAPKKGNWRQIYVFLNID